MLVHFDLIPEHVKDSSDYVYSKSIRFIANIIFVFSNVIMLMILPSFIIDKRRESEKFMFLYIEIHTDIRIRVYFYRTWFNVIIWRLCFDRTYRSVCTLLWETELHCISWKLLHLGKKKNDICAEHRIWSTNLDFFHIICDLDSLKYCSICIFQYIYKITSNITICA